MAELAEAGEANIAGVRSTHQPLRELLLANRAALGSLAVFLAMLVIFFIANPTVF